MFVYGVNHGYLPVGDCFQLHPAQPMRWLRCQGVERRLGYQTRPDDDGACCDSYTEDRGRPSNKDWRGGRGILEKYHPLLHGAAKAVGVVIRVEQS